MNLNRKINGWLVVVAAGVILTILGLLPLSINATKQCSEDANGTIEPDGSHCIIGAPIGPPMWSVGLIVTAIGGAGFVATRNKIK